MGLRLWSDLKKQAATGWCCSHVRVGSVLFTMCSECHVASALSLDIEGTAWNRKNFQKEGNGKLYATVGTRRPNLLLGICFGTAQSGLRGQQRMSVQKNFQTPFMCV